jgi:chemotaxis protein methyltransferase CheR
VVWSVGCSTGDEPYGLAMICREAGANVEILATDVNPDALERAQRGRYPQRNLRHVDDERRERWFRRDGDRWELAAELREMVRFRPHDIIREGAPRHDVDVVVCRNVMVYFTPDQVRCAVGTITSALRPGGLFVLGASEWLRSDLRARDAARLCPLEKAGVIVYQRVDGSTPVEVRLEPRPPAPAAARPAAPPPPPAPATDAAGTVDRLRRDGDAALDAGRPGDALGHYRAAIDQEPLLADLHLRIALAHLHAREAEAARDSLRRALFLTPQLWPAWLILADLAHQSIQTRHCLDRARELLEALDGEDLHDDPLLQPFAGDRRVALDAVRRRLRDLG